jgi:ferredoxin-NADP reductase/predicted pyridoxine 5'-phosphate oxidase superfamily flavin-nucleotide-binding protein
MAHKFAQIAFTESVREVQQELGSRSGYASMDDGEDVNNLLSQREADFISARDSFYMASVSETGWPYVQHRGGPAGFMQVIDERTLGFADFSGNRQYVSVGNIRKDNRVSLYFMDYPNRTRLKVLGRVRLVGDDEPALLASLEVDDYRARVERGFVIDIEAFDWNCPQHITPRFTQSEVDELVTPFVEENRKLKSARGKGIVERPGSLGDGPLALVVTGIRQLTPRIRSYELSSADGSDLPEVEPGSHIQVPVKLEDGKTYIRHYSISSDPARGDIYEIAVLREDDGAGGSRSVHEIYDIGLRLHCNMPQNNFELHDDNRPGMLIAGGIGITPIKAMAHGLKSRGSAVQLHYAGRSGVEMAFRDQLFNELESDITVYRSDQGERLDIERLLAEASGDTVFYVCGPGGLIDAVTRVAGELDIDPDRVRFERFGATIKADAKPIRVELSRSGKKVHVDSDQTVLDAILEAGIDAPYSCLAGNCRTCAVKVLDGEPDHQDTALSPADRDQGGLMCPCVSRATIGHLVLDI